MELCANNESPLDIMFDNMLFWSRQSKDLGAKLQKLFGRIESDEDRRKQLVWAIEKKLAEDGARPIIFYTRGGTCWQPYVKGLTLMVNSIFNGNRREDIWLDK